MIEYILPLAMFLTLLGLMMTGYSIGGVSPIGLAADLPVFLDSSLFRFDTVWSAAGHPHCVFRATPAALLSLTGACREDSIAAGG